MGIHNLAKLIADQAPGAVKDGEIANYFGRKIAIDAYVRLSYRYESCLTKKNLIRCFSSMSIYQFLIAVRQNGENLTNENGETTSHLMGMFYRTIRMIENGIKPVYVFDGKPPQMKSKELEKRLERRTEAQAEMAKAADAGTCQY
jgi:flap endonuclease-1